MLKPEIQNDFSYYRRSIGSKALSNGDVPPPPVGADVANVISMWLAQNLPMISSINGRETRSAAIGHLANVCCGLIIRNVCQEDEVGKVMNIMIAATVIYDRIAPEGSFSNNSLIKVTDLSLPSLIFPCLHLSLFLLQIRKVLKVMGTYQGADRAVLANSLKYSTSHLNDANTPDGIKNEVNAL
jgi:hypothetical protein